MPRITLQKNAKDVIIVTEDHGGHLSGYCFACGSSGWVNGHGYPNRVKNVLGSHLKHRAECPMNAVLKNNGSLKR